MWMVSVDNVLVQIFDRLKFVRTHQTKMHNISNVKIIDPIIKLLESQSISNSYLEFPYLLNSLDLF